MKQRRINATLKRVLPPIAALALTALLILTALPQAGAAAPTVASLSTNPKRINESAAAHSFIRSPFVDSTPGTTTHISAAPRLERQPLESLTKLNGTEATEGDAPLSVASVPSVASVVQSPGTTTRVYAALHGAPVMFTENVGQFDEGDRFQVHDGDPTIWLAKDVLSTAAPPTTMCTSTPIWQIGTFEGVVDTGVGRDEFESGAEFYDVYDYNVDTNPDDEIDAPNFPGVLDDELRSSVTIVQPEPKPSKTGQKLNFYN